MRRPCASASSELSGGQDPRRDRRPDGRPADSRASRTSTWIDHVSALELDEVPESLLVVGAGPVGLEFAQIFARFGSRVTIVNSGPQIAARADTRSGERAAGRPRGRRNRGRAERRRRLVRLEHERAASRRHSAEASIDVSACPARLRARRRTSRSSDSRRIGLEVGARRHRGRRAEPANVRRRHLGGGRRRGRARCSRRSRSTRRASRSRTCSATAHGVADYSVLPTAIFTDPELGGVGLSEAEAVGAGARRRRREASAAVGHARAVHAARSAGSTRSSSTARAAASSACTSSRAARATSSAASPSR